MKHKNALRTIWQTHRPGIDAVLSFATMKIENAVQVERTLSHASVLLQGYRIDDMQFTELGSGGGMRFVLDDGVWQPFNVSADRTGASYRRDQETLQRWLKKIVNWKRLRAKEKSTILGEIKPWTEHNDARVTSHIVEDRLVRGISYDASDVQHVIGEVMYLLFEWGIAQAGGIAACPECQNYFAKDRTDQKVCSNRCRQRQYRRINEASK